MQRLRKSRQTMSSTPHSICPFEASPYCRQSLQSKRKRTRSTVESHHDSGRRLWVIGNSDIRIEIFSIHPTRASKYLLLAANTLERILNGVVRAIRRMESSWTQPPKVLLIVPVIGRFPLRVPLAGLNQTVDTPRDEIIRDWNAEQPARS
jgi:hypothetical protein